MGRHSATGRRFKLLQWFSVLSCITITLSAIASGALLSRFMTDKLLAREATVMMEFVNSVLRVEEVDKYFQKKRGALHGDIEEFFDHVGHLPGVLRANVYARDRSILWSSDSDLIGSRFDTNEELEEAFNGKPHISMHDIGGDQRADHHFKGNLGQQFVETYFPVLSAS